LEDWKSTYVLIAPVSGSVAFAHFYQENQELQNNETIFYINPDNTSVFAELLIPQQKFGKIRKNQKVLLKLPAYPYSEFGAIEGTLVFISNIPSDSGYLAKAELKYGLYTNYSQADILSRGTYCSSKYNYRRRLTLSTIVLSVKKLVTEKLV
jgi:HlyD family secretion protein